MASECWGAGVQDPAPPALQACPCLRDFCVRPSPRPLRALLGSVGSAEHPHPPGFPSHYLSTAQESLGDVWIPEGMFSTFLETHCGLVFRGKGLGRGSAQGKAGGWVGPESRRHSLSAHCVPGDSQMLQTALALQEPHYLVMDTDWKHEKLKTELKTELLVALARSPPTPGLLLLLIGSPGGSADWSPWSCESLRPAPSLRCLGKAFVWVPISIPWGMAAASPCRQPTSSSLSPRGPWTF